jgi:hypothetical protein
MQRDVLVHGPPSRVFDTARRFSSRPVFFSYSPCRPPLFTVLSQCLVNRTGTSTCAQLYIEHDPDVSADPLLTSFRFNSSSTFSFPASTESSSIYVPYCSILNFINMNIFDTPEFVAAHQARGGSPFRSLDRSQQADLLTALHLSISSVSIHPGFNENEARTDAEVKRLNDSLIEMVNIIVRSLVFFLISFLRFLFP